MGHSFRQALAADRDLIAELMRDFYAAMHLPLNALCLTALEAVLNNPELGQVVLILDEQAVAGYLTLTYGYSIERGGKTALLDELFVLPAHRKLGLATAGIQFAINAARENECHAILLEVDHADPKTHSLYMRLGFETLPRHYMTMALKKTMGN